MAKGQSLLQELGDGPHSELFGYTDMEFDTNLTKIGFWVITFTPNNIVHMVIFVDGTMLYRDKKLKFQLCPNLLQSTHNIHTYTHTHTYIYIYVCIFIINTTRNTILICNKYIFITSNIQRLCKTFSAQCRVPRKQCTT